MRHQIVIFSQDRYRDFKYTKTQNSESKKKVNFILKTFLLNKNILKICGFAIFFNLFNYNKFKKKKANKIFKNYLYSKLIPEILQSNDKPELNLPKC